MSTMPGMPGMSELDPLTWSRFFTTWHLELGWLAAGFVLAAGYLALWRAAGAGTSVRPWRAVSFLAGLTLMWVSIASAIGAYAMSLFWMHMVLHLLLIMVVPAFLVLGHPLTVLVEGLAPDAQARARRFLGSRPMGVLTAPAFGALIYTLVIVGTHLTGFMDRMAQHAWLMSAEQVLYVVAGTWFLLPILGEEPLRRNAPYLARLGVLMLAMVPDTIVGIVLLQADTVPFPVMMANHPSWALDPLADVQTAGALMWAAGDGLMMAIAMGLMVSVITSPSRRSRMTGPWLDAARRGALADHAGLAPDELTDADSDAAYEAYNRMLAGLSAREREADEGKPQPPRRR